MSTKQLILFVTACFMVSTSYASPEETLKNYLMFVYGDPGIEEGDVLHSNTDNWMIPGITNKSQIDKVQKEWFYVDDPGVYAGIVGRHVFFVEVRGGKVDPAFPLQGVYSVHRELIRQFFYYSLLQKRKSLSRLVTDVDNIDFGGAPAAARGDMDVYGAILSYLPVVRVSRPEDDRTNKSVTYRIPLGAEGVKFRLIKDGASWKIDSSKRILVPLEFFFRKRKAKK